MKRLLGLLFICLFVVGCSEPKEEFTPTEQKINHFARNSTNSEKTGETDYVFVQMVDLKEICPGGVEMDFYVEGWMTKQDWLKLR